MGTVKPLQDIISYDKTTQMLELWEASDGGELMTTQ